MSVRRLVGRFLYALKEVGFLICVYPADCTDFSSNGFGAVTPMSCTVTETLNGEWELTLVHDIDERGKWTRLSEGCILRAPVPAAMTPSVGLITQQYRAAISVARRLLENKLITQKEFVRIDAVLRRKFSPVWGGLYPDNG